MTDTTSTTPPPGAVTPPQRELNLTWALVLISIAQLMVVLDASIANIALPYIQTDLGISNANLPWIVTGYALAFGSLLLLGGRLADLYGRRRIFIIGLVVFAVASLLGGLATNEPLLRAARGLQGLGPAQREGEKDRVAGGDVRRGDARADPLERRVLGHLEVPGEGGAAEGPQVDVEDRVLRDAGSFGHLSGGFDLHAVALAIAEAQRVGLEILGLGDG